MGMIGALVNKRFFLMGAICLLAACAQQGTMTPEKTDVIVPEETAPAFDQKLLPVSFAALPGWYEDNVFQSIPALRRSCEVFGRMNDDKPIGPNGIGGLAGDWEPVCQEAYSLPDGDSEKARVFYETFFQPYLVSDLVKEKAAAGLFTGYYEAGLRGARSKGGGLSNALI